MSSRDLIRFKESAETADAYEMPSLARRNDHGTERGAMFLELALVLPLLMALVLGIYTGGQAYTEKISVVEAVREGARYGASLPVGTGSVTTWETGVRNRVVSASGGDVAFANVCVEFVLPTGGSECGISDPPGASNEPAVHLVKVSATKQAKIEFFFHTSQPVLRGEVVARFERDTG